MVQEHRVHGPHGHLEQGLELNWRGIGRIGKLSLVTWALLQHTEKNPASGLGATLRTYRVKAEDIPPILVHKSYPAVMNKSGFLCPLKGSLLSCWDDPMMICERIVCHFATHSSAKTGSIVIGRVGGFFLFKSAFELSVRYSSSAFPGDPSPGVCLRTVVGHVYKAHGYKKVRSDSLARVLI